MPRARHTGERHRAAIVAVLGDGSLETLDVAAAVEISRQSAGAALRALERRGVVVAAARARSRNNRGRDTIVWRLAS